VSEDYVLRIPAGLSLERVAPLLCAGITTYTDYPNYEEQAVK
jgi:D-arabinose 1-dehydrogenase-like Zn-dependent alcohol dehydrogenase